MLENCKSAADKGRSLGELSIDLSQAFDCLTHDLLFAKLHAHEFSLPVIKLIYGYLKNRKQRAKIDSTYSS